MTTNPPKITRGWRDWDTDEVQRWTPAEDIIPSTWSERFRVLGSLSEEKGPLRMVRTPYLAGIMDRLVDMNVDQVVFAKPAQIAGTEMGISVIGYFGHQEPCPIFLVMSDKDTAEYMMINRVQKMFEDSPELAGLKGDTWVKNEITLTNGTYIGVGWASSVAGLASRPYRIVILDEIDKPGYYLTTKEANALSLAKERKETYYRFKILMLSTPTIESGNIWKELNAAEVIYHFHVPCPYCGTRQPLVWSRKYASLFKKGLYRGADGRRRRLGGVHWKGGSSATAKQIARAGYKCGKCGRLWSTTQKNEAVVQGDWVPDRKLTGYERSIGFHINRLYSLLGRSGDLAKLVRDFIAAVGATDPLELQGFINSTLADVWRETVAKVDDSEILQARVELEPMTVPQEAIALTAGIDVQKRGFWFTVRAWSKDYVSWLIHYGWLNNWNDVSALLFNTAYPIHERSAKMRIWRAAIDTGGGEGYEHDASLTEQSYFYIRDNGAGRGCRIWGTKGAARPMGKKIKPGTTLDKTPSGKPLPGGLQLIMLDAGMLKDMFHYRLNNAIKGDDGIAAAYLHKAVGNDYAKQISAEEKRIDEKGQLVWVEIRRENHLLDCECLAMACAEPEWVGGGVNILAGRKRIDEYVKRKREAAATGNQRKHKQKRW